MLEKMNAPCEGMARTDAVLAIPSHGAFIFCDLIHQHHLPRRPSEAAQWLQLPKEAKF
jgi:hypothetical protein